MYLIYVYLQFVCVQVPLLAYVALRAILVGVQASDVSLQRGGQLKIAATDVTIEPANIAVAAMDVLTQTIFVLKGGFAVIVGALKRPICPMTVDVLSHAVLFDILAANFTHCSRALVHPTKVCVAHNGRLEDLRAILEPASEGSRGHMQLLHVSTQKLVCLEFCVTMVAD